MLDPVNQPVVNFVREDEEVVFFGDARHFQEAVACHHRARGIIRIADQEGFGAGCDCAFDLETRNLEIIFDACGDYDRRSAREHHARFVRDKAGFRDDDFVARINQREHRAGEGFRNADGNQQFVVGIISDVIAFGEVVAEGTAEF